MQKLLFTFFVITFCTSVAFSQDSTLSKKGIGTINGNVVEDASGKAFPGASVILVSKNHVTPKRMSVADKTGSFIFEHLPFGLFKVEINFMGYSFLTIDSILIRSDKSEFNLGDLRLHKSSNQLNEVVVYAEKPLIENKDGKIVYNVSESPLNSGSNASDMLKNMPLVNTNPDGTILLRGKVPLILMDEKPTNLSAQQLTDFLESLPANVVEKVEIMVNPPPEYATYDGGIINIVTKKGRVGIYARLSESAGTKGEEGTSFNFSYRDAKLNINANAGYGIGEVRGKYYSRRENIFADSVNYFYSDGNYKNKYRRPNFRFQTDYDLSKRSVITFVYQGNLNYFDNFSSTVYQNLDSLKNVYKASTITNANNGNGYSHGLTLAYQWKGINPVERLQAMANINFSKNDNDRNFYQDFLQFNFLPTGLDSTQLQLTNNYTTYYFVRANYNKPLNDSGTIIFTTGSSFSRNNYHNILNTSYLRRFDSTFVSNDLLSNDFLFYQNIFVARAGFIITLPLKLKIITGVQTEYTGTEFKFIKGNASNANNGYWELLPNITLRKEFDKSMNLSLTFRETIRRPGIAELNPTIDYSDPYNIRFGNPYIQPSLTDNYDMHFGYVQSKFNLSASLGFNKVKNVFNLISTLIDSSGKTQTTYKNISNQNGYQASFWSGITITSKFKINISAGYNFTEYSDLEKQLYRYQDGGTFYTTFNYSFAPDNLTVIEANNRYNNYASPQGRTHSNINMSLGIQRKFFDKKLVVSFTAIDPLGLQKYNGITTGSNFIVESYSESNSQNFRLSFNYQISKIFIKNSINDAQKKDALMNLKKNG